VIVADTTVLVYAVGDEHSLRKPCRRLIGLIADGALAATTTAEVIQEFAHVRARRIGRVDAVALAGDYADLFSPLLVPEEADLREGLRLFESLPRLGAFDAILASAARSADAAALVSADAAFSTVPRLAHVLPDEDGVRHLTKLTT
jgi:predicted nucleic acid-binding protein